MRTILKVLFLAFVSVEALAQHMTGIKDTPVGGYLFAHMTSDDYGTLHYSVSKDGLKWRSLANGNRVMNDYRGHPDIITGHDGRFYLLGNPPEGGSIRIWTSEDYITWTHLTDLQPDMQAQPEFNPVTYWHGAPKMYYDQDSRRYIITWHSATEDRQQVHPDVYWGSMRTLFITTRDFKTISNPKRLFDQDIATIDVIIRKVRQRYYAILKDERAPSKEWTTGKSIRIASANKVEGPYQPAGAPVSPNFREAPSLIPRPQDSGFYLYYEQYPGRQYEMSVITDIEQEQWYQEYIQHIDIPEFARHGCMVILTTDQYQKLVNHYGLTGSNQSDDYWLYAGFKDPGDTGVWFSLSTDGINWEELNNEAPWVTLGHDIRRMRDPFLTADPRKGYHLIWTNGNRTIGYAHSEDLVHWSPQRLIPVMADNDSVTNVWAPEMIYDHNSKDWYIYWSSTVLGAFPETRGQVKNERNHRIYYMTTDDFHTFSEPKLFYDPGFPVIDASLYYENGTYYMAIKDERDVPLKKRLHITSSHSILGPWESLSDPLTVSWTEGPSIIKQRNRYIMYYDHYKDKAGMKALVSKDLENWKELKVSFPQKSKHGSFIRISADQAEKLKRYSN